MRDVAVCAVFRARPSKERMRIELPNSGGLGFSMGSIDFAPLFRDDGQVMGLGEALAFLRAGRRIYRAGWGSSDRVVVRMAVSPDGGQRVELYDPATGATPFTASSADILASDWRVAR